MPTRKNWTNGAKTRMIEQAGKIIKNAYQPEKLIESPRRRSSQRVKYLGNEDDVIMDTPDLPMDTNRKNQKYYN